MFEPEIQILATIPVWESSRRKVGIRYYKPLAGSVETKCDVCGQPVWIGPKQQAKKKATPTLPVHCANCIADFMLHNLKADISIEACGSQDGSFVLADGRVILPQGGKDN